MAHIARRLLIIVMITLVVISTSERALPAVAMAGMDAAACPSNVIVLGADLTKAQQAEVVTRLEQIRQAQATLTESVQDEGRQAAGLIPSELLGLVAISSARLTALPATAGLTVHTDKTITLDMADMYASALLIAGVRHADVQITAPTSAPALGTTALLGLLRATDQACQTVPPVRAQLAVRELVLTSHIAQSYGAAAAFSLMTGSLNAGLAAASPTAATLGTIVDRVVEQTHTTLRTTTRTALISLLADVLAAGGQYPDLKRQQDIHAVSPYLATASTSTGQLPVRTLTGVAVAVAGNTLTATIAGVSRQLHPASTGFIVTRNGQTTKLANVRPGDQIIAQVDAQGNTVRLDAHSVSPIVTPTGVALVTVSGHVTSVAANAVSVATTPGGVTRVVHGWSGLTVTLNGHRATLADLHTGDQVTVHTDSNGKVSAIDAVEQSAVSTSTAVAVSRAEVVHGTMMSASSTVLAVTDTATGQKKTLPVVPTTHVTRDGVVVAANALRAGDVVTATLDARGDAASVDAQSKRGAGLSPRSSTASGSAARSGSVLGDSWPYILLAILVIAGLLLLGLRQLPMVAGALPFALVERRSGASDDAAAPATCELTRRARVLCPEGEEGRLAHVVVVPRTGALLRLIVRDRSEILREVPARLIASTNPTVVRLTVNWPDLQAMLADRAPFAPRRYSRLQINRRRPPDNGPLLQVTVDSLRIEVEGAPRL